MKERDSERGDSKGISVLPEDAIDTGLFSSGPAHIKESVYALYDYGGSTKPTPVWLVVYERKGEEPYEQPYSLGRGWKISKDGLTLIPLQGQTGLPKSCNAMKYLIKPLCEALEAANLDPKDFLTGDPSDLEKLGEVVLRRDEQEKRDIRSKDGKGKRGDDKDRSILVIEEVEGDGKKSKSRGKDKDEDKDEDEKPARRGSRDADDDEEERPKGRGKKDADEDEDEKPARGKRGKDKDDDADANELDEEAGEALVSALEAADGPIKVRDLKEALLDALQGNPQKKAIAARGCEDDFLQLETSWEFDGKTVEAKAKSRRR